MDGRVALLRQLLIRAFDGSKWHSLLGSLKGLGEQTFMWHPERHSGFPWMDGSIRDIVFHVTGDKLVQTSAAFGDGSLTWEHIGDRVVKSDLSTMTANLITAHKVVLEALDLESEDSLARKVPTWGGKKMRADEVFLMLAEHDIYHAGQIRYIRNVAE